MNDKPKAKQVSLAGAAAGKAAPKSGGNKKRVLWLVLPVLVVLVLLIVLLARSCGDEGPSLTARETIGYTVTPDNMASKVSYFALGVSGDKSTDVMDMVAVLCYDRKAHKATVMQMPVATYIGEDGSFAAEMLGDVWGSPKEITWCDTCRRALTSGEVDGTVHAGCGTKITTRAGSSFGDLARVMNVQYGLPIDNYLVIPRKGLITLIDAVGGVDVQLDSAVSLDGIRYDKGVRTLPGKAAVAYAVEYGYNGTPEADRARLLRQRQVVAGLLNRLSEYKVDELYNTDPARKDILSNVMLGRNPVRYDTTSFGKARLMGSSEAKGEGTKYIRALAEFVYDISRVKAENVTFFALTGTAQKRGTGTVYSVNKAQTIELLKQYMNPYGLTLDDSTVALPQLKNNQASGDAAVTTLDKLIVTASAENKETK